MERETCRERQRDRKTEIGKTEIGRERQRDRKGQGETERQRCRERQRDRKIRKTETEGETEMERDRKRDMERGASTQEGLFRRRWEGLVLRAPEASPVDSPQHGAD